jgi:hypothetical protein
VPPHKNFCIRNISRKYIVVCCSVYDDDTSILGNRTKWEKVITDDHLQLLLEHEEMCVP